MSDWNSKGQLPCHLAALHGHLETLKFLLEEMNDLCAPDNAHNTIFHYGAENGSVAILHYLATIFPKLILEKNLEGKTSLDVAIRFEKQEPVLFLLEFNNNPEFSDVMEESQFDEEIPDFDVISDSD